MHYATRAVLRAEWTGSAAELRELAALDELGVCEYREEVFHMLGWSPLLCRLFAARRHRAHTFSAHTPLP